MVILYAGHDAARAVSDRFSTGSAPGTAYCNYTERDGLCLIRDGTIQLEITAAGHAMPPKTDESGRYIRGRPRNR